MKAIEFVANAQINEPVELAPYNPLWPVIFEQEATILREIFATDRLIGLEQYGSTAVPGLSAKPIIDILIGLQDFSLSDQEKSLLQNLGYEYIGRALVYERFFLKKRGQHNFHLAVVRHDGVVWRNSCAVRDYLRARPDKAAEYAHIKQRALLDGCDTVLDYAVYKEDFVKQLVKEAREWARILGGNKNGQSKDVARAKKIYGKYWEI